MSVVATLTPYSGGLLQIALTDSGSGNPLNAALTGASAIVANWGITGPTNVTVNQVYVSGSNIILLTTHPLQASGVYTCVIPSGITGGGNPYYGPFSPTFSGIGDTVAIVQQAPIDARKLHVVFSVPTDDSALNPANYTIDQGLSITAVQRVTSVEYILTTSHQLIGTTYTLNAPGVVAGAPYFAVTGNPATPAYWGLSTDPGTYNAAFITGLSNQMPAAQIYGTFVYLGPTAGQYAWYAFPTNFGAVQAAVDFNSWLVFPFNRVATGVIVNGQSYDLYRSAFVLTQSLYSHWY